MTKRKLGKSDVEITPIGLGAWQFSEAKGFHGLFWDSIEPQTRTEIVRESIDGGINWIDTAEVYGFGASEQGVSVSLQELEVTHPDVLVATKWSPFKLTGSRTIGTTIGDRIDNLAPYPITLHQIHMPVPLRSRKREMRQMAKLLEAGNIRTAGVSNFNTKQVQTAFNELEELGYPLVSNQVRYSILDRSVEKWVIPQAKELGMTIIAYSPLSQGLATGRFHNNPETVSNLPWLRKRRISKKLEQSRPVIEVMRSIAEEHQVSIAQIALNWVINFHGDTVVAIPGASKPHHASSNAAAMDFSLSKEELTTLDEISQDFI